MTVIVVLIIAALGVIGTVVLVPAIKTGIRKSSCESMIGEGATARKSNDDYWCCPAGATSVDASSGCQIMDEDGSNPNP